MIEELKVFVVLEPVDLRGRIPLCDAACASARHESLAGIYSRRKGVVAQEFDHSGHMVDPRRGVSLLPIDDRHLVAADDFRDVDLPEIQIEPPLTDRLANRLWICRIASSLGKSTVEATNPT